MWDNASRTGLGLYQARPDKAYSLTDCISIETMRIEGLNEALTSDEHFTQGGLTCLLDRQRQLRCRRHHAPDKPPLADVGPLLLPLLDNRHRAALRQTIFVGRPGFP